MKKYALLFVLAGLMACKDEPDYSQMSMYHRMQGTWNVERASSPNGIWGDVPEGNSVVFTENTAKLISDVGVIDGTVTYNEALIVIEHYNGETYIHINQLDVDTCLDMVAVINGQSVYLLRDANASPINPYQGEYCNNR